ncbi:transducin [Tritrichomonas foetus]|uniref:Transducin n=1 Tax=Tritrichomonas foetus TaxID=1144522 RepID=A0A1J4K492_9EUKA|nr:transducin [Tritrichomonas foetus]|eukprot:OHT04317.1 transducin [Tritrichomonas foetus]
MKQIKNLARSKNFPVMTISGDEVNVLIRRYLQESGYQHTAFLFGREALLDQTGYDNIVLPPQAMINILKKGMLYMQLEKGINERAKNDDSVDNVINSIVDSIKSREPSQPPQRPRSVPDPPVAPPEPTELHPSAGIALKGHFSDVFCGAWTPDGHYLATGSADATSIIWEIEDHTNISNYILDHATQQQRSDKDISTLAWNSSGTILATGCYDGSARLWTNHGELKFVLVKHTEAVFAVQFSPDGKTLLTGSSDAKIIAWSVSTGEVIQTFTHHDQRAFDVDWLDNKTFASCAGDKKICICVLGMQRPQFILQGHTSDVNKICWDPSKRMLASCSDDKTVRVWRPFDRANPIVLSGHTEHVYTIKWVPNNSKIIASGSFDFTVRLWDVQNHSCIHILTAHTHPIYTISFSPKGKFFVSGGVDNVMYIWRTSDANIIASYPTKGCIFEAIWDPTGENISLCLSDGTVVVLPTNTIPLYDE